MYIAVLQPLESRLGRDGTGRDGMGKVIYQTSIEGYAWLQI